MYMVKVIGKLEKKLFENCMPAVIYIFKQHSWKYISLVSS